MTEHLLHAKLVNAEGELIAEGPCWVDEEAGQATMEPERAPGVIQKERGRLALELDTGRSLPVSDRPIIIRMRQPGAGENGRRRLYRLRLLDQSSTELATSAQEVLPEGRTAGGVAEGAQDAEAAGGAGEGAPAGQEVRPRAIGETPAAR